jgi:hypothetical protein
MSFAQSIVNFRSDAPLDAGLSAASNPQAPEVSVKYKILVINSPWNELDFNNQQKLN